MGFRLFYRELRSRRTFRQIQSYRLHIAVQVRFAVLLTTLSVLQFQFPLQAVRSLLSRFSLPSSTRYCGLTIRAERARAAEFLCA